MELYYYQQLVSKHHMFFYEINNNFCKKTYLTVLFIFIDFNNECFYMNYIKLFTNVPLLLDCLSKQLFYRVSEKL